MLQHQLAKQEITETVNLLLTQEKKDQHSNMSKSDQRRKKRLDYCFSRLHLFLHCGIFFLYIYIKCKFFDVQGFQSCQICIALLNVLIIIVLCERPRPLLLIVSSSLFFCSNESQLWLSEASCPLWTAAATSIPFSPMMLARDGCQQTVWFLV